MSLLIVAPLGLIALCRYGIVLLSLFAKSARCGLHKIPREECGEPHSSLIHLCFCVFWGEGPPKRTKTYIKKLKAGFSRPLPDLTRLRVLNNGRPYPYLVPYSYTHIRTDVFVLFVFFYFVFDIFMRCLFIEIMDFKCALLRTSINLIY